MWLDGVGRLVLFLSHAFVNTLTVFDITFRNIFHFASSNVQLPKFRSIGILQDTVPPNFNRTIDMVLSRKVSNESCKMRT